MKKSKVFIVTGMSGAGKSQALKCFEDLGFYCVDNLPVALIPCFAEQLKTSRHLRQTALGLDVREGRFLKGFPAAYDAFRKHGVAHKTIFLDADDELERITTSDTFMGEVVLPFQRYRRGFALHAAAYTVRDDDSRVALGAAPAAERTDNVLGYAFTYNSTRRYPRSVSRSHGMQLRLAAETSDAVEGSDYSGEVYTFDGRAFVPLGREHVLAVHVTYGHGSNSPRPFILGGSKSADFTPLPLDAAVVSSPFNQREYALRGYDSGEFGLIGRRMYTGSLEWRFPVRRIERGIIKVGEEIEIVGIKPTQKTTCTGVEMFRKLLDQGQAGDNVGVLLRGTKREEVERGQVLAKPGSIKPHTKFSAEIYVLSKDEGGRHTPFFNGYRPQFYFRTTDVTGSIELPAGTEMVMPGDNVSIKVSLIAPIAMDEGLRFAIREGGRTVGAGVVAKIEE